MDYLDAASALAGTGRLEGAPARNVTNAHAVTGTAMGNSEGGVVLVDLGGDVTTGDGSQWVEVATDAHVQEGDLVDVLLVGESGRAMTPIVYGVPGGGDRIYEDMDAGDEAAQASAAVAQEAAEAAQAGLNDLADEVRDDYVLLETFNQVSGVIGELVSRLQYGTNQTTGDPFIRILADPSRPNGISLYLTNDRISFYDSDGQEVAYISGDQLYINQGKFASDQNVGDWHWRQRGNDHLTLTYQGGA